MYSKSSTIPSVSQYPDWPDWETCSIGLDRVLVAGHSDTHRLHSDSDGAARWEQVRKVSLRAETRFELLVVMQNLNKSYNQLKNYHKKLREEGLKAVTRRENGVGEDRTRLKSVKIAPFFSEIMFISWIYASSS